MLLVIAGYVATQYVTSSPGPARCTVTTGGEHPEHYELKPQQAANAATITAVASQRELPAQAVKIALATAIQESALRNMAHGDRDSLGLFQQRPSQGWGSERQIQDPVYSSGRFYDHLVRIPGYARLPLTVAAQRVQRSGYPQAYAKHEADAALLTAALTGRRAAALNCTTGSSGGDGKLGSPGEFQARLVREFGSEVLPGRQPEPAASSAENAGLDETESEGASASATASAKDVEGVGTSGSGDRLGPAAGDETSHVRIPVRRGQRGWELAHWAVAHASELHIKQISYRNRVWDASSSEEGWRTREDRAADGSDAGRGAGGQQAVRVRLATGR